MEENILKVIVQEGSDDDCWKRAETQVQETRRAEGDSETEYQG